MKTAKCLGLHVDEARFRALISITCLNDALNGEHARDVEVGTLKAAKAHATGKHRPCAVEICGDWGQTLGVYETTEKGFRCLVPNNAGIMVEGELRPRELNVA